jgi:8-oxo-dGTP diphosphatase
MSFPFNVRVYGLLCNSDGEVLVMDELIAGNKLSKFPGGGLEFGEGTIDCIKRECMEELGITVNVISHFYTTDFFVESFLKKGQQVISIYYLLESADSNTLETSSEPNFDNQNDDGIKSIRWISIDQKLIDSVQLPIDKKVSEMLIKYYSA